MKNIFILLLALSSTTAFATAEKYNVFNNLKLELVKGDVACPLTLNSSVSESVYTKKPQITLSIWGKEGCSDSYICLANQKFERINEGKVTERDLSHLTLFTTTTNTWISINSNVAEITTNHKVSETLKIGDALITDLHLALDLNTGNATYKKSITETKLGSAESESIRCDYKKI